MRSVGCWVIWGTAVARESTRCVPVMHCGGMTPALRDRRDATGSGSWWYLGRHHAVAAGSGVMQTTRS